ncbi:MAG: hypothetical protein RR619_02740 [Raoultibacter sp.]
MSFSDQLYAFQKEAIAKTGADAKKITATLFGAIINDSPVLTGAFKGDWKASQNAPITTSSGRLDPSGVSTLAEMKMVVGGLPNTRDWTCYLSNNKIYGPPIEYLQHSMKAPYGVVRINLSKITQHIRTALHG